MRLRNTLLSMLVASTIHSCTPNAPRVTQKVMDFANDPKLKELVIDSLSHKNSDLTKVVEYNKLLKKYHKPVGNYIVINKKNCTSVVYSPSGDTLYINEVAIGRNVGDKRAGGYGIKGAKLDAYTTPGEFTISREGSRPGSSSERLYGTRVMPISGDHTQQKYIKTQTTALHRVPASPMGKLRENVFANGTIDDNRVSFGCVNYMVDDYDKMRNLIKGIRTKVYILPEEKGNHLKLEKQNDGTYKFFQTKYRTEKQEKKI